MRIRFVNDRVGLLTDGSALYVTRSRGLFWRPVHLTGAGPSANIGALAGNTRALFAIVSADTGTRLYSSPLTYDRWTPVPGAAIPGRGHGDIVANGAGAHVAMTAVYRSHGYRTGSGGTWERAEPPCPVRMDAGLGRGGAPVYALCSGNPGMGDMDKRVKRAAPDGGFATAGWAPDLGITTGFAVASPSTVAVAATGSGAGLVHRGADGGRTWHTPLVVPGFLVSQRLRGAGPHENVIGHRMTGGGREVGRDTIGLSCDLHVS